MHLTEEKSLRLPAAFMKILTSDKSFKRGRHEDATELLDFIFDALEFNAKSLNGSNFSFVFSIRFFFHFVFLFVFSFVFSSLISNENTVATLPWVGLPSSPADSGPRPLRGHLRNPDRHAHPRD